MLNKGQKHMLNTAQLAELTNRLQAPVIISNIIKDRQDLCEETQLALHEIISDLEPDKALLAIALCARKITAAYACASASIKILDRECGKIINDYADLWHNHANGITADQDDALDMLEHIAEDLEGLAALLKLSIPFLQTKDETAAALLKILRIQAAAQGLIAETCLGEINTEIYKDHLPANAIKTLTASSNILNFPIANDDRPYAALSREHSPQSTPA